MRARAREAAFASTNCTPGESVRGPLYHHAIFGLAVGPEYSSALVADVFAMCR
jgi:hypothetical protein